MIKKHIAMGAVALAGTLIFSFAGTSYASSYTVVKGDSLWKIANEKLGDGARYREIFEANKDQIKDPNKIQIGQVLEIPDGQSGPALAPVATPAPEAPEAPLSVISEETGFLGQRKALINNLNTLRVGETNVSETAGAVSTSTRAAENVLVTDYNITGETATNSNIRIFTYKTHNGYQLVSFFTNKDGSESYAVYNISGDGNKADVIYVSANSDIKDKMTLQLKDIVADGEGYIEFTTKMEGIEPYKENVLIDVYDGNGNIIKQGVSYTLEDEYGSDTYSALMPVGSGDVTEINYRIEYGDTTVSTIKVTDGNSRGTLTYSIDAKGSVIMDSVSYVINEDGAPSISSIGNSLDYFDKLKIGEELSTKIAGVVDTVKRVSDNALLAKSTYKDRVIYQGIVIKSPKGLLVSLENSMVDEAVSFLGFGTSKDEGETLDVLFANASDYSLGEKVYDLPLNAYEENKLKTVTTENPDGSRNMKTTYVDGDGNTLNESNIQISKDGSTITSESDTDGVGYNHTYIIKGDHATFTMDIGECLVVMDYDMKGNEVITDSLKIEFK